MTDFLRDLFYKSVNLLFVSHVADIAVGRDTGIFVGCEASVHQILINVIKYNGGSLFRICARQRKSDSVGSSCHKCHFSAQTEIQHISSLFLRGFMHIRSADAARTPTCGRTHFREMSICRICCTSREYLPHSYCAQDAYFLGDIPTILVNVFRKLL